MKRTIRTVSGILVIALWAGLAAFAWFAPKKTVSQAERRPLQQMPQITWNDLQNGSFMGQFETYCLDQFPLRDNFRSLKALWSYHILDYQDNNGIYTEGGHVAKLDFPLNETSVQYAINRFTTIYETYLKDTGSKVYMTVIPDKNFYLAEENGYPAMDYETLFQKVNAGMPWAQTVDITKELDISCYYKTDSHWRQEMILPVAAKLCVAMNAAPPDPQAFTESLASDSFRGVYYGQSALPLDGEDLYLLESEMLNACRVYNHETKTYTGVYDLEKLSGYDPYDVFLSGAQALLTVENPNAESDRELIVFRDSFGSCLVPLLLREYGKVTVVDIRYIRSDLLAENVEFNGQDVLFAYSASILNNSASLK